MLRKALVACGLTVAASHLAAQTTDTLVGALGARADSLLRSLADSGFSGVALVVTNGDVLLSKGYGLADRATNTPMTATTVVQIGSNTKDFTTVAILQLMERGKLGLDDPITKYFANVPADKRAITIDQLLTHRAGFDQHMGPDFDVVTRDQEIARAMAASLLFAPAPTASTPTSATACWRRSSSR